MTRRLAPEALVVAMVVAFSTILFAASDQIQVKANVSNGRVLTSFIATEAWPTEAREVLQAGVLLTFTYDIELRRPSALWLDPVLARTTIQLEAKRDTLMGTYQVTRIRDGRIERPERREQESEVRDWMTSVDQIDLQPTSALEPNREYYVRVRLYMSPRSTISIGAIWPFDRDDGSGRAVFTYLR